MTFNIYCYISNNGELSVRNKKPKKLNHMHFNVNILKNRILVRILFTNESGYLICYKTTSSGLSNLLLHGDNSRKTTIGIDDEDMNNFIFELKELIWRSLNDEILDDIIADYFHEAMSRMKRLSRLVTKIEEISIDEAKNLSFKPKSKSAN